MIAFALSNWRLLLLGGFVLICAAAVGVSRLELAHVRHKLDAVTSEYSMFVANAKAEGDAQNAKAKATDELHASIVKEKDHENAILHDQLNVTAKRLRDLNTNRSYLPPITPSSHRPDLQCFDRAELDTAIRSFDRDIQELVIESESATVDLDTGKKWVKAIH